MATPPTPTPTPTSAPPLAPPLKPSAPSDLARGLWVALAAGSVCLLLLGVAVLRPRTEPLQHLGALPDFTFTRQDGQSFGRAQLLGRPYVANFIFTHCPTICPVFSAKMARVQKHTEALGPQLALVSFSVDPKRDTPEVLTAYAARYGADPARWSFLTGDYNQLRATVVGGFKIAMGREGGEGNDDESDIASIFHGSHFVLVDGQGEIRGYYNSEDEDAVDRVSRDAERLVRGEG